MKDVSLLAELMSSSRFAHCERVAQMAAHLAERWSQPTKSAYTAGLFHDCAKQLSPTLLTERAIGQPEWSYTLYKDYPAVWHGFLAPTVARHYWSITNRDILSAMKWHTTGRKKMTILDKIIFVADFIETGRPWPYRLDLETLAFTHLDAATLMIVSLKIGFLIRHKKRLHPHTFYCYNDLIYSGVDIDKEALSLWLTQ